MQFLPIEERILAKLSNDTLSEKDKIRLRYGFYLVSDTIKKGILIYTPVIFLGLFFEVMIMHVSFFILRQVTFGWHGRTNIECIVFSIIAFIFGPLIINLYPIPSVALLNLSVFVFVTILFIGPKGTKINALDNDETSKLRKKLLIRVFLLCILFLITPVDLQQYILLGVTTQLISLLVQSFLNFRTQKTVVE